MNKLYVVRVLLSEHVIATGIIRADSPEHAELRAYLNHPGASAVWCVCQPVKTAKQRR